MADLGYRDLVSLEATVSTALADLQTVRDGSCAELYLAILRQFHSATMPTWQDRVNNVSAGLNTFLITMYCFALDMGGDNVGFFKHLLADVASCPHVMVLVVYCFSTSGI